MNASPFLQTEKTVSVYTSVLQFNNGQMNNLLYCRRITTAQQITAEHATLNSILSDTLGEQ